MPSRDPSYFRWSQDKPVTTNQTYGYGLATSTSSQATKHCGNGSSSTSCCGNESGSNDSYHHHSCVQCPDCEWSTSRKGGQLCEKHRRRQKTILPSINRFSQKTAVKPINKGYTVGHVPITKKLSAEGASSSQVGVQLQRAVTSPGTYEYHEPKGKDMYLWHALSGSLVHCKNYEQTEAE
jgi:hypothetical protein